MFWVNDMLKKLKKIVSIIVLISSIVGMIAFVMERIEEKKNKAYDLIHKPKGIYEKYIKRPLDAFLATGAFIVFSPILAATAVLVRIKLGSPILFTQERPGRINPQTGKEKIFKLYKFRTMTDDRDENGKLLPDDVRLTSFGKWLRSTSLDELPELINIIKGDMAVIGPRPLLVEYLPYYTDKEKHRHDVRPGLTGLAQVHGRNAIDSWESRFEYDLKYTDNINLTMDISILLKTIVKVIKKSDIQVGSEIKVGRLDVARSGSINKKI